MSTHGLTARLGINKQEVGQNANTWGDILNINLGRLDIAGRGATQIVVTTAQTLDANDITSGSSTAEEEAFFNWIEFTGTPGVTTAITVQAEEMVWRVYNNTDSIINLTPAGGGTPSALAVGKGYILAYVAADTAFTDLGATLEVGTVVTNADLTGHITSTGNAAVLGSFTSAQLLAALTDETGTGSAVFATSPSLITPALGTPSALVGTNITGTAASLTAGNATTVLGAAQTNITSVGTLTSITTSGLTTTDGQVKFPAVLNASADVNTLDDYEEQSSTVTFSVTLGTITVHPSSDTLVFTKVGRVVYVNGTLLVQSVSSPQGTVEILTLPYSSISPIGFTSAHVFRFPVHIRNAVTLADGWNIVGTVNNDNAIDLFQANGGSVGGECQTNTSFYIHFFYFTDD